jgi:hypothetical protein
MTEPVPQWLASPAEAGTISAAGSSVRDAFAVAQRRPDVLSHAVDPGWVPTKMGGPGAAATVKGP